MATNNRMALFEQLSKYVVEKGSCQLVLGFALLSAPLFGQGSYSKSIIPYGSKCLCQQSYFSAIQQCYVMYQLS